MSRSWWRSAADTPVKVVSAWLDPTGQQERLQVIDGDRRFADQDPVRPQERQYQRNKFVGEHFASGEISVTSIQVSEDHVATEPGADGGESLTHVPQKEQVSRWNAIGMGCNLALANVDCAMRKKFTKMIVGPAIAEPELEHVAIQIADQFGR